MKNATKHADTLRSLYRKLTREYPANAKEIAEPLRALVRAAMTYDVSDAKADEAMKAIEKEFVDLNELRVPVTAEKLAVENGELVMQAQINLAAPVREVIPRRLQRRRALRRDRAREK